MENNKWLHKFENPYKKYLAILLVIAVFVGPRLYSIYEKETGLTLEKLKSQIKKIKIKVGNERLDNFLKGVLAVGYTGICLKRYGKDPRLIKAMEDYSKRNEDKLISAITAIESNGGLTASEKEAVDKFAYSIVENNIKNGHILCSNLSERIENGQWDY